MKQKRTRRPAEPSLSTALVPVVRHDAEPGVLRRLSTSRTVWALIGTNLFTFAITVCRVMLSGYLAREQWKAEKSYAVQSDLLSRRLTVLDRYLRVSRRANEAFVLNQVMINEKQRLDAATAASDVAAEAVLLNEIAETMRKYEEIQAEYLAVLQLGARLFGPQVRGVVLRFVQRYNFEAWRASEGDVAAMTQALSEEALLDLGEVPAKNGTTFVARGGPSPSASTLATRPPSTH